jgi:hypothetical protein
MVVHAEVVVGGVDEEGAGGWDDGLEEGPLGVQRCRRRRRLGVVLLQVFVSSNPDRAPGGKDGFAVGARAVQRALPSSNQTREHMMPRGWWRTRAAQRVFSVRGVLSNKMSALKPRIKTIRGPATLCHASLARRPTASQSHPHVSVTRPQGTPKPSSLPV